MHEKIAKVTEMWYNARNIEGQTINCEKSTAQNQTPFFKVSANQHMFGPLMTIKHSKFSVNVAQTKSSYSTQVWMTFTEF